jgi:hypothetical protein
MKKLFFIVNLFILPVLFTYCQEIMTSKINSISIDADAFIGYDQLDSYYFTKNNVLYKQVGEQVINYMNVGLGKLKKVDIINPLKIVLFYEDFNSVVFLDNQLNEKQKINFSDLNTPIIAHAVGMAAKNSIWYFDLNNQKIGLYDYEQNKQIPLSQPLSTSITWYQSNLNYFYWRDNQSTWNSIDVFGKIKKIEENVTDEFLILSGKEYIIHKKNDNESALFLINDNQNKKSQKINIDEKSIKNFSYKNQILTIFTGKEIINYKIQTP